MIRLDSVSKQHGRQILFLEASMGAFAGDRIGLVGPNGAGKSTVFRMIVGEEPPDSGNIVVEKGVTIGYFSQSVGEMSGRSVVAETVASPLEWLMSKHSMRSCAKSSTCRSSASARACVRACCEPSWSSKRAS